MTFKVGDRVRSIKFGDGTIVYIDDHGSCGVRYDEYNHTLHSLDAFGAPKVERGHGWWEPKSNLIPLKKEVVWVLYECADDLPGAYKSGRIHGLYTSKDLAEKDRLELFSNANKFSANMGYLAVLEFKVK